MSIKDKAVMFFATGGFIGNIPFAPGTFGTLPGLFFCWLLAGMDIEMAAAFMAFFVLFAVVMAHKAEKIKGKIDPGCVVIDEMAGMMITLFFLPFTMTSAIAGFFVFRFFDILKPFPIRLLERKIPGGAGIVFDDVLAGIYGNMLLRVIFYGYHAVFYSHSTA